MNILITGSEGFVGTHLSGELSKNHKVIGLDLKSGQDIFNSKLLNKKMEGVDVVIHLAAFISATESWNKPEEYIYNNSLGTLKVVQSAIKNGVKKMIFFSSAAVKAKPLTPYAVSKITAENILHLYFDQINIQIVRPENIYGPGQKAAYGYVIHNFIKEAQSKNKIKIFGDGLQKRDFIYITDVVTAVKKIVSVELKTGNVISLGTGISTRVIDLAKLVIKIVGSDSTILFLEKRKEPRISVGDTKMIEEIGINPSKFVTLKEGVKKLLKKHNEKEK